MRLITRASVRHLRQHAAQLALSVLGVALGVAVVVAIDLAIQSSREAFRVSAETVSGRATHQVVPTGGEIPDTLVATLRIRAGVEASAPVVEGWAQSDAVPGRALRILGVDPFSEGPFRPYVVGSGGGGVDVNAFLTTPGAVVLPAPLAESARVGEGDGLPLRIEGVESHVSVIGIVTPSDPLARAGLADVVLVDVSTAQGLLGQQGRLSRIDLRLPGGEEGERAAQELRGWLPPGVALQEAGARTDTMMGMIAAFDLNLTALSLLALVFGMFLIYNAMTFSVVQRRSIFGRLRALGVTRAEVVRTVMLEALWVGSAGALLGIGLGVVLGRGLVRLVTRTINDLYFTVSVEAVPIQPAVLALGAAVGLGATLLASLPSALEAGSAAPRVSALRSVTEERVRRAVPRVALAGVVLSGAGGAVLALPTTAVPASFAGLFMVMLGMALLAPLGTVLLVSLLRPVLARVGGILGAMAARGVVTALSRTAPAITALVVAVSVTVGLGIMIQSFRGTLMRWLDGTLQADIYVSLPGPQASRATGTLPPELVDSFVRHPEVVGHSTYRGIDFVVDEGVYRLVALELDPRGEAAFEFLEEVAEGAMASFRAGRGVIVSEPFAFRQGVEAGDSVRLPTGEGRRSYLVAGVFRDYGSDQGAVMMARSLYDLSFRDDGITSLGLFLREGATGEAVAEEMLSLVPEGRVVTVRTNRALRTASLEVFDRTFEVTAVLRLLAFIVAFVGVLSALMALELERARELGVLRANGLTPAQVWGLVTAQTGVLGLVSGLLALPLGLVVSVVMIFVINRRSFGWTLEMEVGPGVLLQAIGLALVGALLAGLIPAWRMSRTSPAVALRSE